MYLQPEKQAAESFCETCGVREGYWSVHDPDCPEAEREGSDAGTEKQAGRRSSSVSSENNSGD